MLLATAGGFGNLAGAARWRRDAADAGAGCHGDGRLEVLIPDLDEVVHAQVLDAERCPLSFCEFELVVEQLLSQAVASELLGVGGLLLADIAPLQTRCRDRVPYCHGAARG